MVPGAGHTACTIEMANLGSRIDVAVIDEIQVRRRPACVDRDVGQRWADDSSAACTGSRRHGLATKTGNESALRDAVTSALLLVLTVATCSQSQQRVLLRRWWATSSGGGPGRARCRGCPPTSCTCVATPPPCPWCAPSGSVYFVKSGRRITLVGPQPY